jgi:putative drug exporter of the RND superfamily
MHVMGQWNWWAPRWMVAVHRRLGFNDGQPHAQEPHRDEIEPTGSGPRV